MSNASALDALVERLAALVPPGLREAGEDLRSNLRDALAAGLRELDLVTREEFDVQREVLARTRARLEALEAQLSALEAARREPPAG